ncbi:MAG TPA: MoxR family ATPase [Chromatiales bacterium]|nr:MoxR family ATPase [Thiotrichales bacterium]HIP69545.1 MoxR family ATPase [Chromatiales bacterium]
MNKKLSDNQLEDWLSCASALEAAVKTAIIGQDKAIRLITTALFARGHVLLEGGVGVGKTTLLRAVAKSVGGAYSRIEGTIDLLPNDLVYYTYLDEEGKPRVDPGPLLQQGEELAVFFFNEINRARPQVHSLLLRVMAEHSISAFNRDFHFPHLQVFADRNDLEKEETFELPAAARDRFLMEVKIQAPTDSELQKQLMTDPRFHQVDTLLENVTTAVLPFDQLNDFGKNIQQSIRTSDTLQNYVLTLCQATQKPQDFGVNISDTDPARLVKAGVSPRGMSMLLRTARVAAWLAGRDMVVPEDIHSIFYPTLAHRVFLNPGYELQREAFIPELMKQILNQIAAP